MNRWEFQLSLFVPGIKKATLRATYILFKVFFKVFARLFHGQTLFHLTNKSITKFVLLWWLLSPTSPYTPTQTEKKTLHLSSVVIANIYEEMGSDMVCLSRQYHFNFFKSCLPQILLGPYLNTLTQMSAKVVLCKVFISWQLFAYKSIEHLFARRIFSMYFTKKSERFYFSAIYL